MIDQNVSPSRRGRPRGSLSKRTIFARDWAEKMNCDPVEFLLKVVGSDCIEATEADASGRAVLNAEGQPVRYLAVVPLEMRVQSARELLTFMYPRLQATQVTGEVTVPVEVARLPTLEILQRPELSGALADLAMLIAQQPDGTEDQRAQPLPYGVLHD